MPAKSPPPAHIWPPLFACSREISSLVETWTEAYSHLVGTLQRCSVVDIAADGVSLVGHTKSYVQVLLPAEARDGSGSVLGCVVEARITWAGRWSVKGEVTRVMYRPPPLRERLHGGGLVAISRASAAPGAAPAAVDRQRGGESAQLAPGPAAVGSTMAGEGPQPAVHTASLTARPSPAPSCDASALGAPGSALGVAAVATPDAPQGRAEEPSSGGAVCTSHGGVGSASLSPAGVTATHAAIADVATFSAGQSQAFLLHRTGIPALARRGMLFPADGVDGHVLLESVVWLGILAGLVAVLLSGLLTLVR